MTLMSATNKMQKYRTVIAALADLTVDYCHFTVEAIPSHDAPTFVDVADPDSDIVEQEIGEDAAAVQSVVDYGGFIEWFNVYHGAARVATYAVVIDFTGCVDCVYARSTQ